MVDAKSSSSRPALTEHQKGDFGNWVLHQGQDSRGVELGGISPDLVKDGKVGLYRSTRAAITGTNAKGERVEFIGRKTNGDGDDLVVTHYKANGGPVIKLAQELTVEFDYDGVSTVKPGSSKELNSIVNPLPKFPVLQNGVAAFVLDKINDIPVSPYPTGLKGADYKPVHKALFEHRDDNSRIAGSLVKTHPDFIPLEEVSYWQKRTNNELPAQGFLAPDSVLPENKELIAVTNERGAIVTIFAADTQKDSTTLRLTQRADRAANGSWLVNQLHAPIILSSDPNKGLDGGEISAALQSSAPQTLIAGSLRAAATASVVAPGQISGAQQTNHIPAPAATPVIGTVRPTNGR